MNRTVASLFLFCASFLFAPLTASAANITIPTVPVGDAGNANDPSDGDTNRSGIQNCGAVGYDYRIGTTEVTNAQYVAFLNAKAVSDPLALYNTNMGANARGGITRSGVSGSYTYAPKTNMADKPVNYVSWYDSIRFANWLNNGQGASDTETGAYTLGPLGGSFGIPTNGPGITRNAGATWALPTENEWYKAAYYQPAVQGGDSDDYWLYPTASNSAPTMATANSVGDISNPGSNVVNYNNGAVWNGVSDGFGNLTTVGSAGPLSQSFYGTSDQGGNVFEWNETVIRVIDRGTRGGSFFVFANVLQPSAQSDHQMQVEVDYVGFRVALVPEPSSLILAALGLIGFAAWGWRRKR